jgi:8-oxo-dGTP pyrophosphatase MutT (NUDIX family)
MTTPNIDLLLSDITFRNGIRAESVVVTVHNGDDTQFAVVALRDLIDEVRALREQRDAAVKRRREIDDEAFDYAEQIETLKTQLAAARELMEEAAVDIGYMVNAEYHGPDDVHPAMRAKYARDMEIVSRLTASLTPEDA